MRKIQTGRLKLNPYAKITLRGDRDSLHDQVRDWAKENGLVVAPTSMIGGGMHRCGMMPEAQYSSVAKWHNLTLAEQDECVAVATFKDDITGRLVEIEVRAPLSAALGESHDNT